MSFYILNSNKQPVPASFDTYKNQDRRIRLTEVYSPFSYGEKLITISTVFLGMDHGGYWFESLVCAGDGISGEEYDMIRYKTYEDAKDGHNELICKAAQDINLLHSPIYADPIDPFCHLDIKVIGGYEEYGLYNLSISISYLDIETAQCTYWERSMELDYHDFISHMARSATTELDEAATDDFRTRQLAWQKLFPEPDMWERQIKFLEGTIPRSK